MSFKILKQHYIKKLIKVSSLNNINIYSGEIFINDVKISEDLSLKANDACIAVQNMVAEQENRLAQISSKWEIEEQNQIEHQNSNKVNFLQFFNYF